eukprot:CAMPEP_0175882868 /NCGR_PEP_ID=MMETSP0107_2-20121207/43655_1 /TAXON_ID=195067 ORGANISM="Goniomonas pacifica, Strain CCMP1869" /NCGR_SAMPLE_ID=MMETSP0107_2 /ASSEMBLY_ACC=CAM_ASM_000203 /LENGTH=58 /DNA_ID=CAMNT_0017202857 /DNA_START=23 /DNA_END=196 /DNA_ORIENTATION=+
MIVLQELDLVELELDLVDVDVGCSTTLTPPRGVQGPLGGLHLRQMRTQRGVGLHDKTG